MVECEIVTLADIPYPYNRVLSRLLKYDLLNGREFSPEDFDMDLDYDPEVRAEWGSPHLGSLNNNSNEFHEAISEVVQFKMSDVIRNLKEWVDEDFMDNVFVDLSYSGDGEKFQSYDFSTESWNESHSSKGGNGDIGIVHFITKGYIDLNVMYEPSYSIFEMPNLHQRTYFIPMQLIGTITGQYGLNKKGNWEGYIDANAFALTQIDDGIVNMRHLSAIVECIE